ncbi:DUF2846 domain-containing protein [Myxococcota bacterium]|nr:DUF2846 domain-containing protein [Myxococcota bacterium]
MPTRSPRLPALAVLIIASIWAGCARPPTPGPAFAPAPEPAPGHARIYLFRVDPQHSLSRIEIALDGHKRGHLGNDEYVTFEVGPGPHHLDFRQRGLAFASWGWNHQALIARAGETIFLEISVRISAQPMPGSSRDLEIAGRGGGAASENVFIQHRSREDAFALLANTTLHSE